MGGRTSLKETKTGLSQDSLVTRHVRRQNEEIISAKLRLSWTSPNREKVKESTSLRRVPGVAVFVNSAVTKRTKPHSNERPR